MAIVIEERKNQASIMGILSWLVVLGMIVFVVYYIFVRKPEIIEFNTPDNLRAIEQIQSIQLDPGIAKLPQMTQRTQVGQPLNTQTTGRPNPFLPF